MNYMKYIDDTQKQFTGYNFNQYFNIGLIMLTCFILGLVAN